MPLDHSKDIYLIENFRLQEIKSLLNYLCLVIFKIAVVKQQNENYLTLAMICDKND